MRTICLRQSWYSAEACFVTSQARTTLNHSALEWVTFARDLLLMPCATEAQYWLKGVLARLSESSSDLFSIAMVIVSVLALEKMIVEGHC